MGSLRISKIELSLKREHDFQSAGDTPKIDSLASHLASFWTLPAELLVFWAAPGPLPAEPGPLCEGSDLGKDFSIFWRSARSAGKGLLKPARRNARLPWGRIWRGGEESRIEI